MDAHGLQSQLTDRPAGPETAQKFFVRRGPSERARGRCGRLPLWAIRTRTNVCTALLRNRSATRQLKACPGQKLPVSIGSADQNSHRAGRPIIYNRTDFGKVGRRKPGVRRSLWGHDCARRSNHLLRTGG